VPGYAATTLDAGPLADIAVLASPGARLKIRHDMF